MKHITVVLLLALVICVGTTFGAGGQEEGASTTNVEGSAETPELVRDPSLTWETADLSWKKDTSPVSFSMYIDFAWYERDVWGEDPVSQLITELTGVTLDVTKGTDRRQLQVLLAADELPELVFMRGNDSTKYFWDSAVSYPWDELIAQYAPEFYSLVSPAEVVNATAPDGHFYTLWTHPYTDVEWEDPNWIPSNGYNALHIRTDVMEELGNPRLESFDDFERILATVKDRYPDMIPYLPFGKNPFHTIALQMGLPAPRGLYYDGEKVTYAVNHPGYRAFFTYLNSWYRNGYFDQEAFALSNLPQHMQVVQDGNVFATAGPSYVSRDANRVFVDNGIDAWMSPLSQAIEWQGEDRFHLPISRLGWASFVITQKNENPDRAIRFAEFLKSPFGDKLTVWGIEGTDYTLSPEGLLERPAGFNDTSMVDHGLNLWRFLASGYTEGILDASVRLTEPRFSQYADYLLWLKDRVVVDTPMYYASPAAGTDALVTNTKINTLIQNQTIAILTADSEAEVLELYEQMLSDIERIGSAEVEAVMTENYLEARQRYEGVEEYVGSDVPDAYR